MSPIEFNRQLCDAIGIDIKGVTKVQITIEGHEPPRVEVTLRPESATYERLVTVIGQLHFRVGS
jgi:hypothetical protein